MLSEPITIAVVPRDRFSMFRACLEALYKHTAPPFRIIVVAGAVDRRTEDYLRKLESQKDNLSVELLDPLMMQGEARNLALRRAEGRFCVVMENDTIVHDNWLPPLVECMHEERAAVVTPLILWYRGIHAAGGMFDQRTKNGTVEFRHRILYTELRRRPIDYPENHCLLIDRQLLQTTDVFDDVEPFDVDLGLTLRQMGLKAFFEPRSVATYSAPPRWEVGDLPPYKFRWDPAAWESRNRLFMRKWSVVYDPSRKLASYRRQQLKLGLARWYPTRITVEVANLAVAMVNRLTLFAVKTPSYSPERTSLPPK